MPFFDYTQKNQAKFFSLFLKERFEAPPSNLSTTTNILQTTESRKLRTVSINHVFRKFATHEVWLPNLYWKLSVAVVTNGLAFAEVVFADNAIAVNGVDKLLNANNIDWLNSGTGKRKKAVKPIEKQKTGGVREKMAVIKKTWMMRVQHPAIPVLSCLYNS